VLADSRLRILELRSVFGTGGGPEKTILLSAAHADRARFDVTVSYIRDQRDSVFRIHDRAHGLGVTYAEVTERHSFDPRIWRSLRQLVRDRRIDIVHAHDYKTNLLTLMLARAEGIIPLSTAHGWTGHSWREQRLYYPIDRRLLARFPLVLAVSSDIRSALLRAGARPDRVEVVLNSIDPDAFRRAREREPAARAALGLQPGDVVLGAVGRREPP
jgi:glycosyltransferase involved in cell wall biosynthesis